MKQNVPRHPAEGLTKGQQLVSYFCWFRIVVQTNFQNLLPFVFSTEYISYWYSTRLDQFLPVWQTVLDFLFQCEPYFLCKCSCREKERLQQQFFRCFDKPRTSDIFMEERKKRIISVGRVVEYSCLISALFLVVCRSRALSFSTPNLNSVCCVCDLLQSTNANML